MRASRGTGVLRYAAFTDAGGGGNPAGVVLDAGSLTDDDMLAIARDLGYSESAFVVPTGTDALHVRYFSPLAEVAFCGHATIAAAVAEPVLAEALAAIGWAADDLEAAYPPHVAFARNDHLLLGVRSRATLSALHYDFDRLAKLMQKERWTTVHMFWAEGDGVPHVRNAFPPEASWRTRQRARRQRPSAVTCVRSAWSVHRCD